MLATKTVWVGALLNIVALKGRRSDAAASDQFTLVNARANAGREPGINFAELHSGFGEGDAFDAAHFGVRGQQQRELVLEREFEGIFTKRALPAVDVGVFWDHDYVSAFC